MTTAELIDTDATTRDLIRRLRGSIANADGILPESVAWQTFLELRKRGEGRAVPLFMGALKNLHSRRCIAGADLPVADAMIDEHRLADDPYLADLWKAYKKCIRNQRTGPASQLLRDIESRIQ